MEKAICTRPILWAFFHFIWGLTNASNLRDSLISKWPQCSSCLFIWCIFTQDRTTHPNGDGRFFSFLWENRAFYIYANKITETWCMYIICGTMVEGSIGQFSLQYFVAEWDCMLFTYTPHPNNNEAKLRWPLEMPSGVSSRVSFCLFENRFSKFIFPETLLQLFRFLTLHKCLRTQCWEFLHCTHISNLSLMFRVCQILLIPLWSRTQRQCTIKVQLV